MILLKCKTVENRFHWLRCFACHSGWSTPALPEEILSSSSWKDLQELQVKTREAEIEALVVDTWFFRILAQMKSHQEFIK